MKDLLDQAMTPEVAAIISKWMTAVADRVKNPLASFTMGLEQIQVQLEQHEESATPLEVKRIYELLERLQSRVSHLVSYVDEIAWFTRPVELQLRWQDLESFLDGIAEELRAQIAFSGQLSIANCLRPGMQIYADKTAIEMVVRALVVNAIEANPSLEHHAIDIEVTQQADCVEFRIQDHGIGFSDAILTKVGQPFFSTKLASAGLGLAITSKLIAAHGGHLRFANAQTPKKGGLVTIVFPLQMFGLDALKG